MDNVSFQQDEPKVEFKTLLFDLRPEIIPENSEFKQAAWPA
jgi:hypothetical protein